jgi:hypothetical protein
LLANPIRHPPLQRLNACIRQQAGSYDWMTTQSSYGSVGCHKRQTDGIG